MMNGRGNFVCLQSFFSRIRFIIRMKSYIAFFLYSQQITVYLLIDSCSVILAKEIIIKRKMEEIHCY